MNAGSRTRGGRKDRCITLQLASSDKHSSNGNTSHSECCSVLARVITNTRLQQFESLRLVIKRIVILEGVINRSRLLIRLLGLLLRSLRSGHIGGRNVVIARGLEGVRLVSSLQLTPTPLAYGLLSGSSSSRLLGGSGSNARRDLSGILVELTTLLEGRMLAHDEAREDAEDDADRAHNNTHQRNLVLTVRAAEDPQGTDRGICRTARAQYSVPAARQRLQHTV